MMFKSLRRFTYSLLAILLASLSVPLLAKADGQSTTTHTLNNSYVVYGAGVASEHYADLDNVLGTDSNFKKLTSTASDYRKYISDSTNTTDAAMISSVAIAPGDPGSGVKVNIKDYNGSNNITTVTAQQYALVAQMAGVTDVTIVVTANRPVSGEAALTGVYKAFSADGATLNTTNTATANQMLDATQDAINANSDDKTYPGKLMAAVGDTTKQIAQEKQDGNSLTTDQIAKLLEEALAKRGISEQTTTNQVNNIVNVLVNFQNSPISSSSKYVSNVGNTINNVKNSTGNLMNKAKDWASSLDTKKASETAQNWFQKLIAWIQSLFN
ncbi:hypothetical protein AYP76_02410 [Ligilactobacillus agilis]|uniref:DUF1002 domain-containing protein n=1 Tax=Ligilactobacillus agilis TaxID=1601 RepID=A0A226RJQ9_9LACO|nr:hypothetical protein AYP76_02410 [Ligilactobacillus agilis]OXC10431.1 hypothetical protein AYP75_05915 [Ligilactobacillus agilis]OXC10619.1 hypothetical protein AYP74_00115 [Ligilactobacillus agilis]OXS39067.1 hypothetical protein AYP69_00920 [Ligilactobacillus agilis]OXS41681.1 hypothetical protein AYP70_03040 [Ligilactobacillus agilis]